MSEWIWDNQQGMQYIRLPEWEQLGAIAAFSSRWAGASDSPFQSLNMGLHVGDDPRKVIANRRNFLKLFACDLADTVCCEQIHGHDVMVVDESHKGRGAWAYSESIPRHDAMVTNQTGINLLTFYADCLPLFFFDPDKKVIGLAHSGWKGTMGRIAGQVLKALRQNYDCLIADIKVFIGPGIGRCCYSVQPDLAGQVVENFPGYQDIVFSDPDGIKWDLKNTNKQILLEAGVQASNLTICDLCTACNGADFFSYRAEQGRTGRMAAFITLNPVK